MTNHGKSMLAMSAGAVLCVAGPVTGLCGTTFGSHVATMAGAAVGILGMVLVALATVSFSKTERADASEPESTA